MVIHGHRGVRYRITDPADEWSRAGSPRGTGKEEGGNRLGPLTSVALSSPFASKETTPAQHPFQKTAVIISKLLSHPRQHASSQLKLAD